MKNYQILPLGVRNLQFRNYVVEETHSECLSFLATKVRFFLVPPLCANVYVLHLACIHSTSTGPPGANAFTQVPKHEETNWPSDLRQKEGNPTNDAEKGVCKALQNVILPGKSQLLSNCAYLRHTTINRVFTCCRTNV